MGYMLCRNKVRDYGKWREVFDADKKAHRDAGLVLIKIWRAEAEPNTVFFLFEAERRDRAEDFINAPDAEEQAKASGVVDGEYHFLNSEALY